MEQPAVHMSAIPNALPCSALHLKATADRSLELTPGDAGWRYLSFRTAALAAGAAVEVARSGQEAVVVVISGGGIVVEAGARTFDLPGRASPFEALPWAIYLPASGAAVVRGRPDGSSADGRVSIGVAEASPSGASGVAREPFVIGPDDVEVEIRGAGNATRQINKIVRPETAADRLLVVEVLTPSGNWSSWPPHKHDRDDMPSEAVLEEIYLYRFARPEAWGLQRLYRADRSRDCVFEVHDGDCVVVTDGYHPFVASHGDHAYYLNALAGDRRTMACSFDPDLDWVRGTWAEMAPDPRLPMVPARPPVPR